LTRARSTRGLLRALEADLGPGIEVRPGEWEFNCPFCQRHGDPDPSHHLGVNVEKGAYHCWRCGAKGRLRALLPRGWTFPAGPPGGRDGRCASPRRPSRPEQGTLGLGEVDHEIPGYVPCTTDPAEFNEVEMVYNHRMVRDYARNRGVEPVRFPCGSSLELPQRLVWPITQEGRLVYYQARTIKAYVEPKMLNPDASWGRKSDVLWGFDLAGRRRDVLVVCEGPFDAVAVWRKAGQAAVAVLGCEISATQARLIDYLRPGRAVVLFDGDAGMKAKGSAYRLRRICRPSIDVAYVRWPEDLVSEDPDSLGRERLWELVADGWEAVR
jgi:hypothetical protein